MAAASGLKRRFLLPSLSENELYDSLTDAVVFLVRSLKRGLLFSILK